MGRLCPKRSERSGELRLGKRPRIPPTLATGGIEAAKPWAPPSCFRSFSVSYNAFAGPVKKQNDCPIPPLWYIHHSKTKPSFWGMLPVFWYETKTGVVRILVNFFSM